MGLVDPPLQILVIEPSDKTVPPQVVGDLRTCVQVGQSPLHPQNHLVTLSNPGAWPGAVSSTAPPSPPVGITVPLLSAAARICPAPYL